MALIEINKSPSPRELTWFGILLGLFFTVVGSLIWFRFERPMLAYTLWGTGTGIVLLYWALLPLRRLFYLGWMYAFFPIGWLVSHLLLGGVYYGLLTPIGLIMRAAGYDPMQGHFEPDSKTYWTKHPSGQDASRYFRQF